MGATTPGPQPTHLTITSALERYHPGRYTTLGNGIENCVPLWSTAA
ncbi:protein of unknown function [Ralstonia solanacearum CMR15]|nr:protein of unknown function [Ralstonia solanacearum CMR15]